MLVIIPKDLLRILKYSMSLTLDQMEGEKKVSRLQYYKDYREKNKEKIAMRKKEYYEENKEHLRAYKKNYEQENKDYIRQQRKAFREANKELVAERKKENMV